MCVEESCVRALELQAFGAETDTIISKARALRKKRTLDAEGVARLPDYTFLEPFYRLAGSMQRGELYRVLWVANALTYLPKGILLTDGYLHLRSGMKPTGMARDPYVPGTIRVSRTFAEGDPQMQEPQQLAESFLNEIGSTRLGHRLLKEYHANLEK